MTPSPLRPESVLSRLQEMERLPEYERIDLDAVAAGAVAALDGYSRYVQQVAAWLDDQVGDASGRHG